MATDDDEISCRICWGDEPVDELIRPCKCEGSGSHVHTQCLEDWLKVNPSGYCVACQGKYVLPWLMELKRASRKCLQVLKTFFTAAIGLIFVTAFIAKPLGIIMWFGLSATNSNPFDAPMLLSMLRSKETWNGIEEDVDELLAMRHLPPVAHPRSLRRMSMLLGAGGGHSTSTSTLDFDNPPNLNATSPIFSRSQLAKFRLALPRNYYGALNFLRRFSPEDCFHLRKSVQVPTRNGWAVQQVEQFLNKTCNVHPLFGHVPQLRFCRCLDSKPELVLAHVIVETLRSLRAPQFLCPSNGPSMRNQSSQFSDDAYAQFSSDDGGNFSAQHLHGFLRPVRLVPRASGLLDLLLPLVYPKFKQLLPYVPSGAKRVNWRAETRNPRFYGLPFYYMDDPNNVQYVIRGLDLHLAILLTVGVVVDGFLVLGVLHTGLNAIGDPFGPAFDDIEPAPQLHDSDTEAGFFAGLWHWAGSIFSGFGTTSLASTHISSSISSWSKSLKPNFKKTWCNFKSLMSAQWESLALTFLIIIQSFRIWWEDATWQTLLRDLGVMLCGACVVFVVYVSMMVVISVVVLSMYEAEVLVTGQMS